MKKIILAIAVIGFMSCSDQDPSGGREVTKIVKVKTADGDLDWVRLNTVEMRVFTVGDTIRINRTLHRITADTPSVKAVIINITK